MVAGPIARLLSQLLMVGGGAFVRAVRTAYTEAAQKGAQHAPNAKTLTQALSRRMSVDEAAKIMDVELQALTESQLVKKRDLLHGSNAPADDFQGSPYIQKRILNSFEVLRRHVDTAKKGSKPNDS